ncbi:lectin-like protein [Nitrosomonas ureae]|nr:lectin-like protein [Nitrosomonas ureae]
MGGHLATIKNAAENSWIYDTFTPLIQSVAGSTLWIGLTDVGHVGSFEWASGEPVTYTNWSPGQPDHARGNEDYAHIWTPNLNQPTVQGQWNDLENNPSVFDIHPFGVVQVVPEPETWAMMLLGLGLVGYQVMRRNKLKK